MAKHALHPTQCKDLQRRPNLFTVATLQLSEWRLPPAQAIFYPSQIVTLQALPVPAKGEGYNTVHLIWLLLIGLNAMPLSCFPMTLAEKRKPWAEPIKPKEGKGAIEQVSRTTRPCQLHFNSASPLLEVFCARAAS